MSNKRGCFPWRDFLFPIILSLLQNGCFREVVLEPQSLRPSSEDDIIVTLKDGRRINFLQREYGLVEKGGKECLAGKGRVYSLGSSQFSPFEGDIPIDTIENIKTSEKTSMFYVSLISAGLLVGFVAFWLTALNGRGFGG